MDVLHGTPLVINAMSNEHGLLYVPLANSILSPWSGLAGGSPKKWKGGKSKTFSQQRGGAGIYPKPNTSTTPWQKPYKNQTEDCEV